jgi:hypothetical protein
MKKTLLLALSLVTLTSLSPALAANTAGGGGDGPIRNSVKAVGRAIMWGPKKVAQGLKAIGHGTKKMFGGT